MEKVSNMKITKKEVLLKLDAVASDVKKDFPDLSEQLLRDIAFDIYQLKQTVNYVNEHVTIQGNYKIFVNQHENR